jgi:hypothetical protein
MKRIVVFLIFFNLFSCSLNLKKEPVIGDSSDTILNYSTWGKPKNKKVIVRSNGNDEEWIYERGVLYIKGGELTSIQEFKEK